MYLKDTFAFERYLFTITVTHSYYILISVSVLNIHVVSCILQIHLHLRSSRQNFLGNSSSFALLSLATCHAPLRRPLAATNAPLICGHVARNELLMGFGCCCCCCPKRALHVATTNISLDAPNEFGASRKAFKGAEQGAEREYLSHGVATLTKLRQAI